MPSRINEILPPSNFEVIKEAIATILAEEIDYQTSQQGLKKINVYSGLNSAFSHSDVCLIDVVFGGFNNDSQGQNGSQQTLNFYVDVYSSGKSSPGKTGGENSSILRDKVLGFVINIIKAQQYVTLGFEAGIIGGVDLQRAENYIITNEQDAAKLKISRLSIDVRTFQKVNVPRGKNFVLNETQVKISNTEKGFQYIFQND